MTPYEAGFAEGEASAWRDRGRRQRIAPQYIANQRERGFWDGYTPRNPVWALRSDPRPHWQQEAE